MEQERVTLSINRDGHWAFIGLGLLIEADFYKLTAS